MSQLPALPVELWQKILDCITGDDRMLTLKAFSLVCKHWLAIARPPVLSTLILKYSRREPQSSRCKLAVQVLTRNPRYIPFVCSLELLFDTTKVAPPILFVDRHLPRLLRMLTHVKDLRLCGRAPFSAIFPPVVDAVRYLVDLSTFQSLDLIYWSIYREDAIFARLLASASKRLATLSFDCMFQRREGTVVSVDRVVNFPLVELPHLTTMHVGYLATIWGAHWASPDLHNSGPWHFNAPNLRSLFFCFSHGALDFVLAGFLPFTWPHNLTRLSISITNFDIATSSPSRPQLNLSRLTNLRHLELRLEAMYCDPGQSWLIVEWATRGLATLPNPSLLESFLLRLDTLSHSISESADTWRNLDKFLAPLAQNGTLSSVIFELRLVTNSYTRRRPIKDFNPIARRIESHMQGLHSAAILQISQPIRRMTTTEE
ncbi:hypothetical protein HGRIS_004180 [Hohenbuehelia grisea]|uniref:F-box domain-containing protein n=1 Tax=Hohenbuehelia grisea TaxID=104357 RepID=A0ABR3JIJ5_9AGAR